MSQYQLVLDASTKTLLVGLHIDDQFTDEEVISGRMQHAENIIPTIENLLNRNSITTKSLDVMYICTGPGSYTGIRLAVMTAKMFAYTLSIELREISTLGLMASCVRPKNGYVIPLIDARREHVYSGLYHWGDDRLELVHDDRYLHISQVKTWASEYDAHIICMHNELESIDDVKNVQLTSKHLNFLKYQVIDNVYSLEPKYIRQPEAVRNWQQNQLK